MWFNSIDYLLFFVVVYSIYWFAPQASKKYILLIASFFFYAYWSLGFFVHFLAVTAISYLCVIGIRKTKSNRFMIIGIIFNISNLLFFKYSQSIINGYISYNPQALSFFSEFPNIILPLAISFYSFQIIAFIVDTYRNQTADIGFLDFLLFIFFFPQLIAGPIMRHSDFFHQLKNIRQNESDTIEALYRILSGVFKKVLIADQMARIINPIWADPLSFSGTTTLLAILGFSIQIFCDFSGYTDIARGCALLLGYRIPENFRAPYFSLNFAELWSRWHITLSTWLRDYLYIPLGGSRVSALRLNFNTIIVMSLGGLWHGNTYAYLIWGFLHGSILVIERRLGKATVESPIPKKILGWAIVTFFWLVGAFAFRSGNWDVLSKMIASFSNPGKTKIFLEQFFGLVVLCYLIQFFEWKDFFANRIKWNHYITIPVLSLILYFAISRIPVIQEQFIYFQF
ncbi:MBOAT family O-acyltransferase [Leptospira sp. GIMC2001]|uniref:MBOAT family O-acyltransferase n=1 Tax=Leptospira sp. GIMC2001 TaxID=1513297 RepID=UPI00234AFBA7|nr:MBOAT family O-acyltransferase [Leptospira sp. GIMC2001]WCL50924.1 MBOAT family protein [Leptospira sp. GIMC2001]